MKPRLRLRCQLVGAGCDLLIWRVEGPQYLTRWSYSARNAVADYIRNVSKVTD